MSRTKGSFDMLHMLDVLDMLGMHYILNMLDMLYILDMLDMLDMVTNLKTGGLPSSHQHGSVRFY